MPKTLEEWQAYVRQLAGADLRSKGINANTQMFADALLEEDYEMSDVEQIILFFVRQFVATGQKIPEGGAWDMVTMAADDPVSQRGPTMTEEEADDLAINPPDEGEDSIDQELAEASQDDDQTA